MLNALENVSANVLMIKMKLKCFKEIQRLVENRFVLLNRSCEFKMGKSHKLGCLCPAQYYQIMLYISLSTDSDNHKLFF